MAKNAQDDLLRAAFNIEGTSEAIPSATEVIDETIDLVLKKWRTRAVSMVGGENANNTYLEMKADLRPVNAEVETVLTEVETALGALADTRREARAEAGR